MDEKTIKRAKIPAEISAADLPIINAILAREDTVNLTPGPKGSVKIIHIKRKIVKTVQGKDCAKC